MWKKIRKYEFNENDMSVIFMKSKFSSTVSLIMRCMVMYLINTVRTKEVMQY